MRRMMTILMVGFLVLPLVALAGQEQTKPKEAVTAPVPVPSAPIPEKIKAWPLPTHMIEALNNFVNAKVEEYRKFLKSSVKNFEDMPDNAVFDMSTGLFMRPEDVPKIRQMIQDDAANRAAIKPEPIKK